ncbi:hypothetical protein Dsin_008928 [Dipteronia sinensis]|uniref:Ubiquitin-like protease family profile domain-containing protein n=1 Tax=Dipteronia sinensis TaxID=43782 RepID=A0AAE0EB53_9ROSI|nr:hypothetical protein Dsin_008928 [Dipteronia sinensis]
MSTLALVSKEVLVHAPAEASDASAELDTWLEPHSCHLLPCTSYKLVDNEEKKNHIIFGNPDGHWILCPIDLDKLNVCIYYPLHRQKKIGTRRKQITILLRFILAILQQSGYFQQKDIPPNGEMFSVHQSIPKKLSAQLYNDSCGVFICRYTDMLMRHKCFWGWGTKNVPKFKKEIVLEIFANSVASE